MRSSLFSLHIVACAIILIFPVRSTAGEVWPLTERIYHDVPVVLYDGDYYVDIPESDEVHCFTLEARGAMAGIGERPGLSPNFWGLDVIASGDTLRLSLRHGNSSFGDIFDRRENHITVSNGNKAIFSKNAEGFESSSGVYNTLHIEIDNGKKLMNISGGGKQLEEIASIPIDEFSKPMAMRIWSKGELTLSSISTETSLFPDKTLSTIWNEDTLTDYLRTTDNEIEGYWQYLDRENDPQYSRLGGRYLLAVVKSGTHENMYDIIYVDGAETRRDQWQPMMLKGRLMPTIFLNHYDLMWIDSTFELIEQDIHASITDGAIMTLSFPLLKMSMRFSRMSLAR